MPECIFCNIVAKKIPAAIIYEDDTVIAFEDINPRAPVHVVITPKSHETDYTVFLGKAAREVAKLKKVDQSGYRLIMNKGKDARQEIDHIHMHLLAGKDLGKMI